MTAGPFMDSSRTFEFPSRQVSEVPEVLLESVGITEQETIFPAATFLGAAVPHDVKSIVEMISTEIAFIGSLHPFLLEPWL